MADDAAKTQNTERSGQGTQAAEGGQGAGQLAPRGGGRLATGMPSLLAPWPIGTGVRRLFEDFDRLFEDMQRSFFGRPLLGQSLLEEWTAAPTMGAMGAFGWTPRIEMRDTGREVVLAAELPGVDPKDVSVECTEDGLTIRGESRAEETSEEGGIYRSERRYGSFYRHIPLPPELDLDKAQAQFQNGLLKIRLPKTEAAQQRIRRIPIQAEAGAGQTSPPGQGGQTGGRGGRAA
ncbi:MAG TPA: Hsp20/alpha crystallin family protein [Thermodesulfobacteriota bacterium]